MPRPDKEIVAEIVSAWNRRDLDAILELADPEVEYVNAPMSLEPGTRHGHDGLSIVFCKQWEGMGANAEQRIDDFYPDGETLITAGRVSRTMPGSDATMENRVAIRWAFREGRVFRLEVLGAGSSFDEALKGSGL